MAVQYDCKFIETSTVLNINIDELLVGILKQIRLKDKLEKKVKSNGSDIGCINKSKHLLTKLFGRDNLSKSCENLYVLWFIVCLSVLKTVINVKKCNSFLDDLRIISFLTFCKKQFFIHKVFKNIYDEVKFLFIAFNSVQS